MLETIKKVAEQNPFGFTFNLKTATLVRFGIVVAYKETQDCFGDTGLQKAIDHAKQHDNIIGAWLNSENGRFYYDSCRIFKSRKAAIEFGIKNEQIAIFDLTNLEEIKL